MHAKKESLNQGIQSGFKECPPGRKVKIKAFNQASKNARQAGKLKSRHAGRSVMDPTWGAVLMKQKSRQNVSGARHHRNKEKHDHPSNG